MDINQGNFNAMPSDYDDLTTGTHNGFYVGYVVLEDATITEFTPLNKLKKTNTEEVVAGITVPVPFTQIKITGGTVRAYIG